MFSVKSRQSRKAHGVFGYGVPGVLRPSKGVPPMTKILSAVLAAGLMLSAGSAYAAAPKTKAACEKVKAMKWDDISSKCVKK
jgi:hypothetical protein